jgi:beta-glucanase (GH16 family)
MSNETFHYGKFIAKIKGDDKLGTCTSFFTFWKGDATETWSEAGWSEIDIELVPSAHYGTLSTNIIWNNQQHSAHQVDRAIADPEDGWAIYEFQWTPDWVAWLYNGQERRKVWRSDENPEIEWL